MRICILSMQRNEGVLLETWAHYHGKLFGYENIHLFDNGSDDSLTIEVLHTLERLGVSLYRDYRTRSDYENKGTVIVNKINELDRTSDEFDFYFPLDCDEFLSAADEHGYYFDSDSIFEKLHPFE